MHVNFEGKELSQTRFNEIEKYVLEYFHGIWTDVRESIYLLRKKNSKLVKSELSLVFIGADALSRFGEIVTTGKEEKTSQKRFRDWIDSFVISERNEAYNKHRPEIGCNSFVLWKLRNSLLHFFGLPEKELICFAAVDEVTRKSFKDYVVRARPGQRLIVVNPYRLIEAVLQGFLMQTESLMEMIKGNNDSEKEVYVKGILKCYQIIQNEGTVHVPFNKKQ